MRKSIFLMVLSLVAVLAVACGGGNANTNKANGAGGNGGTENGGEANGGGGDADPYALYKKEGRSWMTKNSSKTGDNPASVSFQKTEIVSVADDHAMVKYTTLGEDKKPIAGMPEPEPTRMDFAKADTTAPEGDAPKIERTEETIEAAGQSWDCWVMTTENSGMTTKSWTSKKYPGLAIKSETTGEMAGVGKMTSSSELVEWNE